MAAVDVNEFSREKQCRYQGERYCVRDNGAVLRYPAEDKRPRANDNRWTFGKENSANPYLHIASVRIHRIVATAFHGEPPNQTYVVDHIDSNCRNNRPENLRWLTRLENALKNPATLKKIEFLCGSVEAFLSNPSMLNKLQGSPSIEWMRTVTPEEAKNCMERMAVWASSEKKSARSISVIGGKSSFSKRVYKPLQKWEVGFGREPGLYLSKTLWCAQFFWRAPAFFPCCPREFGADPLDDYFQKLKAGAVMAYTDNDDDICPKLTILECRILKSSILVLSERADGKWSIVGVERDEKTKYFIHYILGSYSSKDEADIAFRAKNESTNFYSEAYAAQGSS
jgi:hypothetical protein